MNRLLKKRMLIISISLAFLLLINIGVSYSYYLGKVVGNESDTTLSFKSAGIKVQYENNSGEIIAGDILSGWSATKNFSLSSSISENDFTNGNSKLWYEIILYVDQNDFPSDIITYTLTPSETVVGSGVAAESRTNAGIPTGTNAEGVNIGVGYFTVGSNKHDYSITFNYVGNGSEYGNYPDSNFSVHIGAKVIISSVLNIDLDGGSIEGNTVKYVSKGGTINLPIPTKENALFLGWVISGGDGEVDGNNVTVNDEVLNIIALWKDINQNLVLMVDFDGGTSTQEGVIDAKANDVITLVTPTKDGFVFRGWNLLKGTADIVNDKIVLYDENVKIVALWENGVPEFTYLKSDGTAAKYTLLKDTSSDWRIKFLESGTLTFTTYGNADNGIDVFLVGGGGGADNTTSSSGGGGGGYTLTEKSFPAALNTNYSVVIGAGGGEGSRGGTSSAFGFSAAGGYGKASGYYGCAGGSGGGGYSGGKGGSDGSNGGGAKGGTGQGTTTREFGESTGDLYAGGGGGGGGYGSNPGEAGRISGGSGGGGFGGFWYGPDGQVSGSVSATAGTENTGGGGGGRGYYGGAKGGSGIVIIRNARG